MDCVPGASPSSVRLKVEPGLEGDRSGEVPRPQPAEGPVADLQGPGADRAVHVERPQDHVDRSRLPPKSIPPSVSVPWPCMRELADADDRAGELVGFADRA